MRLSRAENAEEIAAAYPDPEPLTAVTEDEFDRTPIWEVGA